MTHSVLSLAHGLQSVYLHRPDLASGRKWLQALRRPVVPPGVMTQYECLRGWAGQMGWDGGICGLPGIWFRSRCGTWSCQCSDRILSTSPTRPERRAQLISIPWSHWDLNSSPGDRCIIEEKIAGCRVCMVYMELKKKKAVRVKLVSCNQTFLLRHTEHKWHNYNMMCSSEK